MNDINPILEVQGLGGARLLLFQDSLRIEGKGWRAFLFQGTAKIGRFCKFEKFGV